MYSVKWINAKKCIYILSEHHYENLDDGIMERENDDESKEFFINRYNWCTRRNRMQYKNYIGSDSCYSLTLSRIRISEPTSIQYTYQVNLFIFDIKKNESNALELSNNAKHEKIIKFIEQDSMESRKKAKEMYHKMEKKLLTTRRGNHVDSIKKHKEYLAKKNSRHSVISLSRNGQIILSEVILWK